MAAIKKVSVPIYFGRETWYAVVSVSIPCHLYYNIYGMHCKKCDVKYVYKNQLYLL